MTDRKFLIIDTAILPDIYEKVLETKELLRTGKARGVTEATQMTGISRSTYYKYKDFISTPSEGSRGQKATITLLLDHTPGNLSDLLNVMADCNVNILTINQDIPINGIANVSITFDISEASMGIDEILEELRSRDGTSKVELIAME
ncbi:ACT domain-containing protein [Crassaminicella profunda]|uniref:ACT domain-containing protein n=1 Tax=Crassaminicella profunda TaxID=1286698 RepID=UPI001CA64451|nr:ACT domain-containing protein [Crassaminicella profunda]QZY54664.1 ACT domain-containing protein [Crassaminicella profunda]